MAAASGPPEWRRPAVRKSTIGRSRLSRAGHEVEDRWDNFATEDRLDTKQQRTDGTSRSRGQTSQEEAEYRLVGVSRGNKDDLIYGFGWKITRYGWWNKGTGYWIDRLQE